MKLYNVKIANKHIASSPLCLVFLGIILALCLVCSPAATFAQEFDDGDEAFEEELLEEGEDDLGAEGGEEEGDGGELEEEEGTGFDPEALGITPAKNAFWRWGYYEVTAQRFSGPHPFYRMTESPFFQNGRTAANSTYDNLGFINNGIDPITGPLNHDLNQNFWVRFIHSIPPGSLEYIVPVDAGFVKSWGVEMYYTNTWLTDNVAAVGKKRQRDTPILHMRAHYYMLSYTMTFFFPPGKNGVELFYGGGLAQTEVTYKYGFRRAGLPAYLRPEVRWKIFTNIQRSNTPTPQFFQRVGISSSGDNFGVSLGLYLFGENDFIKNRFYGNRYMEVKPRAKNVSLGGLIMRISMHYSFWD